MYIQTLKITIGCVGHAHTHVKELQATTLHGARISMNQEAIQLAAILGLDFMSAGGNKAAVHTIDNPFWAEFEIKEV